MSILNVKHRVLLGLESKGNHHWDQLKWASAQVAGFAEVEEVSSVYEVSPDSENPENTSDIKSLSVVLSLATKLSPIEFRDHLAAAFTPDKFVTAHVFLMDDEFKMSPELTLPHPELHLKPHWVIPASELWGNYEHPVLNLPLSTLAGRHSSNAWGVFFAQGKTLFER